MGGPNKQGGQRKFQNLINGLEFDKRLEMIIQGWKEQKQVVIKHRLNYTGVCYFAINIGCKSINNERK